MTKLDILAVGVHPDDVEISAGGTVIRHVLERKKVGVLHLTKGELGTRGSAAIRMKEAAAAAAIMGVEIHDNMTFRDGFFENDEKHRLKLIEKIRLYRPDVVLCNALHDRHPDHGRASQLVSESCFYSGLARIKTKYQGKGQAAWRPKAVYHYIQDRSMQPSFVVDISDQMEKKMKAIQAYRSQFFDPSSKEPQTYISTPEFLDSIRNRCAEYGRIIGVRYAEAFVAERIFGISSLSDLI
ncbi:MAG TPA: bacillithiol biosynthesis deacetylase BshB1 [Bacteroidia bacterium]|jgi:bacillithiol biosynthesis deacetylase BshB1